MSFCTCARASFEFCFSCIKCCDSFHKQKCTFVSSPPSTEAAVKLQNWKQRKIVLHFQYVRDVKSLMFLPFLCSDPSQSDSNTRDFWMNMQAVTVYLKKLSEQNPSASYYNVDVLKYQVRIVWGVDSESSRAIFASPRWQLHVR